LVGIHTGTIISIDTPSSFYQIKFDKPSLGTQFLPDYCVKRVDPEENQIINNVSKNSDVDSSTVPLDAFIQAYSVKYLCAIHQYAECLKRKQGLVKNLKEENLKLESYLAEKYTSDNASIDANFHENYTGLIKKIYATDHEISDLKSVIKAGPKQVPETNNFNPTNNPSKILDIMMKIISSQDSSDIEQLKLDCFNILSNLNIKDSEKNDLFSKFETQFLSAIRTIQSF